MNKIAIITLNDNNNYGNRLQNFALNYYIEKLGLRSQTIWIQTKKYSILRKSVKKVFGIFINKYKLNKRQKNLQRFTKKYIPTRLLYIKKLSKLNLKFHKVIVGSDQVWNPDVTKENNFYFLPFITDANKKIAYAASVGLNEFNNYYKSQLKNNLTKEKFGYISTREKIGQDLINQYANRNDVELLIDPTLLLTKDEWATLERKPKNLNNKKYILNYFLGNLNENRKNEIEKIAKNNHYEIINIMNKNDLYYGSSVEEFLYLEHNAELICTDSFHSCIFAILFEKNFIVFDREEKDFNNMGMRIDNLLNLLKIKNRKFVNTIQLSQLRCDYSKTNKILNEEREKANKFLKKALK